MINIFQTPYTREDTSLANVKKFFTFNPWSVQNVVFEMVKQHLLRNDPSKDGFMIAQKYDADKNKSQIYLGMSYDWKTEEGKKRPAIFIQRDNAQKATQLPWRQVIESDAVSSTVTKLSITSMPVFIKVIATNVGDVEQLATWIRNSFLTYQQEIKQDFGFRMFQLTNMTPPKPVQEDKENFEVTLVISTVFDENFRVQKDTMRLKTVAFSIFDALGQPFLEQ